jgi:hypothetical protein
VSVDGEHPRHLGQSTGTWAAVGFGRLFRHNVRLAGGPGPVRVHIEELLPDIVEATIEPGTFSTSPTVRDGAPGWSGLLVRRALGARLPAQHPAADH